MDIETFLNNYWSQYLLLEKEFIMSSEYVSIEKNNFSTYSNQYLKQLLAICSEFDIVANELCKITGNKKSKNNLNIVQCRDAIKLCCPNIIFDNVYTCYPYKRLSIRPFAKWEEDSLEWWNAYNSVKHARTEIDNRQNNYEKANLKNVLYSLAGLYAINLELYKILYDEKEDKDKIEIIPNPYSQIFEMENRKPR